MKFVLKFLQLTKLQFVRLKKTLQRKQQVVRTEKHLKIIQTYKNITK